MSKVDNNDCCNKKCNQTPSGTNNIDFKCYSDDLYCCNKKCFQAPVEQVDGMACSICGSFGYCTCKCETTKEMMEKYRPVKPFKIYKFNELYTCCRNRCTVFQLSDIESCFRCQSFDFCQCILNDCVNRNDWFC